MTSLPASQRLHATLPPAVALLIGAAMLLGSVLASFGVAWLGGVNILQAARSSSQVPAWLALSADTHVWSTAHSRYHRLGRPDKQGWAASVGDGAGHMNYGPYTRQIPYGPHVATFRLMIDSPDGSSQPVVNLDVFDSYTGQEVAQMQVLRNQFKKEMTYQDFDLPFTAPVGGVLEFRTYYLNVCYVNQEEVRVVPAKMP